MALIDFTLSNARRFYSSMGNPLGLKGLNLVHITTILSYTSATIIIIKNNNNNYCLRQRLMVSVVSV